MKKYIALLLIAAVLAFSAISACADEPPAADTEVQDDSAAVTMSVGMPNPLRESSVKEILKEIGVRLPAPEFANSASWFVIKGEPVIGELRFTVYGKNYNYRVASMSSFSDISGMYYQWTDSAVASVGYNSAAVSFIKGEQGIIQWYDAAPGLMYSLSVDSGADAKALTEMAGSIYTPVQGDVTGDPLAVSGTVYGSVVYASGTDFSLSFNGQLYSFRVIPGTIITTPYFDTGDYLCVQYSGDPANSAVAVRIDKVEIVVPTPDPWPTPVPTYQPYIDPVVNPMISGTGTLMAWGDYCSIATDAGDYINLALSSNLSMPIGYFPQSGDYVSFTYNSALGELCELACISRAPSGDDGIFVGGVTAPNT